MQTRSPQDTQSILLRQLAFLVAKTSTKFVATKKTRHLHTNHTSMSTHVPNVYFNQLWIGGISTRLTKASLMKDFQRFGHVESIQLPMNFETQNNKGYCFVHFALEQAALQCMLNMHNTRYYDRTISVRFRAKETPVSSARVEAERRYIETMEADIGHWMSSETLGYRPKITEVREKMAAFLGCSADDLVLVDNASNAINILLARLGLTPTPLNATAPLDQAPGVLLALSVVPAGDAVPESATAATVVAAMRAAVTVALVEMTAAGTVVAAQWAD